MRSTTNFSARPAANSARAFLVSHKGGQSEKEREKERPAEREFRKEIKKRKRRSEKERRKNKEEEAGTREINKKEKRKKEGKRGNFGHFKSIALLCFLLLVSFLFFAALGTRCPSILEPGP